MPLSRRFILKSVPLLYLASTSLVKAAPRHCSLEIAVQSPWMANQVAVTRNKLLFLGLPRYSAEFATPSLARQAQDGSMQPFPGNSWNTWKPGDDGREAFVYLNSVHMFDDETVWCVDQGSLSAGIFGEQYSKPLPGAQKIVQLDAKSGEIRRILRFDDQILPDGAQMNDLRLHGSRLYISDSGVGGIIIHDLKTGETQRRLSGFAVVKANDKAPPAILAHVKGKQAFHPPNSDMIEITRDGHWLYWAAPTGPLYRIETRYLLNRKLSDAELVQHVEAVYENNFSGGCAMDSEGNIYFSETATNNITIWSPTGKTAILVSDSRLIRPDGSFISHDRRLYIPVKHPAGSVSGVDIKNPVFNIYSVKLPVEKEGIRLGTAMGMR